MNFSFFGTALAQGAAAPRGPSMLEQLILPMGLLAIMWFFIIRPQGKKIKEHRKFLESLKPGDEVVTASGILGRVKSIQEGIVSIDAGGSSFRILKEQISGAFEKPAGGEKK
jgi:preprotein translocase subunit YajC